MKTIISEKIVRIIKNKKKLEEILNVKISINGQEVIIDGTPEDEHDATQVIDALNFGFPFAAAISIKEEERVFEIIPIKQYAKTSNLERVRGRIIGKNGKALATLSKVSDSYLELKDNQVGVISHAENLESVTEGLVELIQGAKHGNVYKGIENNQPRPIIDLGLKESPHEEE